MTRDRYAVIGHPVEHSKSPFIHARFAELTGEPVEYGKLLAPLDAFEATVRGWRQAGGRGCNVTVPFKFQAATLATRRSARAELAGACNILRFDADGSIYGDNTDGIGLVHDIQQHAGVALAGRDVLLVGAGGAAAGVLGPMLQARPRRLVLANRTLARAAVLLERHAALAQSLGVEIAAFPLDQVPAGFHVVVNATASSLGGEAVPVTASVLRPGALACDLMYGPGAEPFLQWAREHGAVGRDGLGMLVEQAAEAFFVWRGVHPPTAGVVAELRAALSRG
jgi:shikimate dehydrogenase